MILVTGATGNIGRELARELDAKGARFRMLVRDPARAAGLPERAERAVGDLSQPATLEAALAGVDRFRRRVRDPGWHHLSHSIKTEISTIVAKLRPGKTPGRPRRGKQKPEFMGLSSETNNRAARSLSRYASWGAGTG